ncbi:tonB-dependent receptor [Alistipes sp. CAG:831]|nr:tonB-dependent receptor [Alistipes sp. CAG:831]
MQILTSHLHCGLSENLYFCSGLQDTIFTSCGSRTFDFTAQLNGPSRLPDFAVAPGESGFSPVYPVLFAQITRKFKGVDVYIGAENLTNYRQKHPILEAGDPWSSDFNASVVWGPITGITVYAGVRFTLWK